MSGQQPGAVVVYARGDDLRIGRILQTYSSPPRVAVHGPQGPEWIEPGDLIEPGDARAAAMEAVHFKAEDIVGGTFSGPVRVLRKFGADLRAGRIRRFSAELLTMVPLWILYSEAADLAKRFGVEIVDY